MNPIENLPEPWHEPWPSDGLEAIRNCPVCGDLRRELLYADLVDNVFRVSPGKWQLWRCAGCGSAYLDPRPTADSIHIAYATYYTHREPEGRDDYESLAPFRKLRRRLVNGYTNWRYSTQARPASALGIAAAFAAPTVKRVIDQQYRHLPRRPESGARVLDVGCGDGYFLSLARSCGWRVMGIDPDPQAGSNRDGLKIGRGGIEYLDGASELFDAITLNHAIEHVYDPVDVLRRCHALLKTGGQLWLETPNINSLGHAHFKSHWRGLEPPRHLILFNPSSLRYAVTQAGFRASKRQTRPDPSLGMFRQSWALERGNSPYEATDPPKALRRAALRAAFRAALFPRSTEFLVLTATK